MAKFAAEFAVVNGDIVRNHEQEEEVRLNMLLSFHSKDNPNQRASVVFRQNGDVITDLWKAGDWRKVTDPDFIRRALEARKAGFQACSTAPFWKELQDADMNAVSEAVSSPVYNTSSSGAQYSGAAPEKTKFDAVALVKKWMDFFSEFQFKPQVRFINSLARMTSVEGVTDYVIGYFALTNNSFAKDVAEKTKSVEFKDLANKTINTTTRKINQRLEIYYGEPGTGKTTTAIANHPEAKVEICHASMTPDELFRGFDFDKDGRPMFKPCAIKEAMINGLVVILDEINLLNEDCRRALQAITDAKDSVTINNEVIPIKEGFKVIGTMNLNVDDMVFPLPAPLVDRAEVIKEFTFGAKDVAALAF